MQMAKWRQPIWKITCDPNYTTSRKDKTVEKIEPSVVARQLGNVEGLKRWNMGDFYGSETIVYDTRYYVFSKKLLKVYSTENEL